MDPQIGEDWDLCEDVSSSSQPSQKLNDQSIKDFEIFDQAIPASKLNMIPSRKSSDPEDQNPHQALPSQNQGHPIPTIAPSPYPSSPLDPQSFIRALGFQSTPLENLPKSLRLAIANRFTRAQLSQFAQDAEMAFSHSLPYFFSGSLMFPACLRAVTNGRTLEGIAKCMTPATLRGYRRYAVEGKPYPAMLPFASSVPGSGGVGEEEQEGGVTGVLVFGMLESQRRAIHRFENGMYDLRRERVEIELVGGDRVLVEVGVYVWNRGRELLVNRERDWRAEDLMGSEWFSKIVANAEEEKALEGGRTNVLMGDW